MDLSSCSHLLDIGPGFGAQLSLWKSRFQVEKTTALEPNREAWQRAKARENTTTVVLCERLEDFETSEAVDCAVAVDSCYHISYSVFWSSLQALPSLKSVALSDLFLLRKPLLSDRIFLRFIALCARIPYENFRTKDQYLQTSGMQVASWEDASDQVIDGFCNFVSAEVKTRSLLQMIFKEQLLKIYCTYLLLRRLRSKKMIGYALIVFKPKP